MIPEQSEGLAAFSFEKSNVGTLLKLQSFPTLGEISWSVASDLEWVPYHMPYEEYRHFRHEEYWPFLWELLDEQFCDRLDYRLWRLAEKRLYPSKHTERWPQVWETAREVLQSQEGVVVWGSLAVLAGLLTSKRLRELFPDKECRTETAKECERRLVAGIDPVPEAEIGCALIKALTWSAIQQVQCSSHREFSSEEAGIFFDRLEESLRQADPNWQPGEMLYVGNALKSEWKSGRVVLPYNPVEVQMRVAEALFGARDMALARGKVRILDEAGDRLLKRAALFTFSSWRFTRSLRIGEEVFQCKNPSYVYYYSVNKLQKKEMIALLRLGQALRDAGYHLDAAFASWLLLTLLPNELLSEHEFSNIGSRLAGALRNVGMVVPARFVRPKEENRLNARHSRPVPISITNGDQGQTVTSFDETSKNGGFDPFKQRLAQELQTDARWKEIQRLDPQASADPLGALSRVVDRRKESAVNPNALETAFGLCLRYGRLREAAQVAECLQLDGSELLDLAHSMKRALRRNLLSVAPGTHLEWCNTLRRSWHDLPNRATLGRDRILVLHEVLLGRYPSILRDVESEFSRQLALKLYDQLDDEAIRELVDIGPQAFQRGPGTVNTEKLQESLQGMQVGSFATPVCVSVVRLGEDLASLIAVGKDKTEIKEISLPRIRAAAAQVRSTYDRWLSRSQTQMLNIPWHSSLRKIGDTIGRLVRKLDPECRWLVLAIEPDLASLPWTNLLADTGPGNLLVSLVPSFSWFVKAAEDGWCTETRATALKISSEPDLCDVAARIEQDRELFQERIGSCGVVLGHGQTTNEGIPLVTTGDGAITLNEWLDLAVHRVLIVHSCHSGRMSRSLPGDLGGLPGLALSIGCRLCLAPVAEVPTDAAATLHNELVQRDGPAEIGLRYQAAIQKNPAVALYNLYGFPNETVKT